jgi:hypothetical protein
VTVKFELSRRRGHHRGIVTPRDGFAAEELNQADHHGGVAEFFLHCQQAHLTPRPSGRQMGFEIRQFGFERKRTLQPQGDHAGEFLTRQTDDVHVLVVKTVHEPAVLIAVVLGNLLRKGAVVEPVDGFHFPRLAGDFEC